MIIDCIYTKKYPVRQLWFFIILNIEIYVVDKMSKETIATIISFVITCKYKGNNNYKIKFLKLFKVDNMIL